MRTSVFICYSHRDSKFKNELLTYLQPYRDAVDVWSDSSIPPGVQWAPEIDRALTQADAAVIVVSPDLVASKFVTERELPRILKRHSQDGMRPMWIHYRPAAYKKIALAGIQCLHDPEKPLSTLRRPIRDSKLVAIVEKICEPPAQRFVGNVMRAADEVFTAEHGTPSVTAVVGPNRIDMWESGHTRPFLTASELEQRLTSSQRAVLRAHERSMDTLLRRWSRLHPRVAGTGRLDSREARELAAIRSALAKEFDEALGLIESLGYGLDDHYQAVRHVIGRDSSTTKRQLASLSKPAIAAQFVLDRKSRPQWSRGENGYWLQSWVVDAPARTGSVVWRMHPTISPVRETVEARPEFRKDFVTHGDFVLKAELRTTTRAPIRTLRQPLAEALARQYPEPRNPAVQQVLDEIAEN